MTYENWPVTNGICHWSLANSHMSFKTVRAFLWLTSVFFEEQCSVGSAETKRIRQGVSNIPLTSLVWHVIEIAIRIWNFVINGRGHHASFNDKGCNSRFDSAGGAE